MHIVGYTSDWIPGLCSYQSRHQMPSKQSFHDGHYGLILVSLIGKQSGVTTFHLLSIPTMCSPYCTYTRPEWDYTECM